ncbi:MAG: glycosyltransferase [Verrucomicrobia bacterium]|nr:glycosyltransferase [Verrucomicrobiota bacterium]
MKLLFVSNLFPDSQEPWRGLDNVTLVHALRALDPGLDVRVLAFRASLTHYGVASHLRPRAEDEMLHPHYFWNSYLPKLGGLNHWLFARALARAELTLEEDFRPDVILAPWLFPDACAAAMCFRSRKIPLVAVAQGSDVHQYLGMTMRRRAILSLAKCARKIVTRSQDLQRRLISGGANANQVCTIYNGVDTAVFRPASREDARAELGVSVTGKLVLFVGNFLPVKGIDLLMEAFAEVARSLHEPITLSLIGSGPLEGHIRQQAAELGISQRVIFVGRQPPSKVARWMQAADVVSLSSFNEGVPNVVLESISSGRPIVTTDVGGIAEIVKPLLGQRFLVPGRESSAFAAALTSSIRNPPEDQRLHHAALQYSWENCAKNYLALLNPAGRVG